MPINRDGKHWCNPASKTPDPETQVWVCPCGHEWQYWAELLLWCDAGVDPRPTSPETEIEPTEEDVA